MAGVIISLGVKINSSWVNYEGFFPFEHWCSSGFGATIGGVTTAIIVKYAKVAYAILIGFILLFIAMLDIIVFPYHPTFYKILIFITYFPFAWLGGKIVEVIYERNKRKEFPKSK